MPEDDATTTSVPPRHGAPDTDPPPTRARHSREAHSPAKHGARRPRRRVVVLAVATAVVAAGVFLAGMVVGGSTAPAPVAAPVLPVAGPPIVPVATTPPTSTSTRPSTTTRTATSSRRTSATRATVRPVADTSAGCGHRAVSRGVFNAACSEYQGYLDPGRAAGRAPSSGDLQHDDGCQKGYIPKSEC